MYPEEKLKLKQVLHTVKGFEDWSIVAKTATPQKRRHPTGYAILKRDTMPDCIVVNLDEGDQINYVARISDKDAPDVYDNFIRIYVLDKVEKPKFTVSGELTTGINCTLGKFVGNIELGKNDDPNIVTYHLSGDPTNNNGWNLARERRDKHGSFHGSLGRKSSEEDIRRVAAAVDDEQMRTYYCSEDGHDNYRPRTFPECEAENAKYYFSGISERDYDDLMDAIRQEIRNCNK